MFKVNEYFEGKVKSIAFKDGDCDATIGVMATGEYEFGTSTKELMTVISGKLEVKFLGCDNWHSYGKYDTFTVEANKKFQVKVEADSTYICRYLENADENCGCNCNC
ncbi:MAG: pyrimidine/purine nucleoside phosphorylase [Candidatus Cloacimonetes bacterium]|nr:pyrimidine/purine nucleoside phosphorylase [Candidatus Cloacimonadota bacterium]